MARPIRFTSGTYRRAHKRARDVEHRLWCDSFWSPVASEEWRRQVHQTWMIRRRARREGKALFEGWNA